MQPVVQSLESPSLPATLGAAEARLQSLLHSEEDRQHQPELLLISPATVNNRLADARELLARWRSITTNPSLLKSPIRLS